MPNIQVGNRIIKFPNSGSDAQWSQPVIDFAQAVAQELQGISSEYDVNPRVQTLISNTNTNLAISGLTFPNSAVRGFTVSYAIYRTNTVDSLVQTGTFSGIYDTVNSNWVVEHEFVGERQSNGLPYHTFGMSGDNVTLSTIAMTGSYDNINSNISYSAKTLLLSNT